MEEVILDGKKYISSKRAAEISGYSHDYIGQLVRAGNLSGRLIGRTRFVEEESFLKYFEHTDSDNNTASEVQNNITPKTYSKKEREQPPSEFSGYSHGWQSHSRFDTAVEINIETERSSENIFSEKISQIKNLSHFWQGKPRLWRGKLPYTTAFVSMLLVVSGVFVLFSSNEINNRLAYTAKTETPINQKINQTAAVADIGILDDITSNIKKAIDSLAFRTYKNISAGGNRLISFVSGLFGGTGQNFFALFNKDENTNITSETVTTGSSAPKFAPVKITQSNQIETEEQSTKNVSTGNPDRNVGESPRIIERIIERVVEKIPATIVTTEPTSPAVAGQAPETSSTDVDSKLEQLKNKVFSEIYKVADGLSNKTNTVYQAVSLTNKIDTLNSVSISNASIIGSTYAGSVTGTSGSFSDSLSANGGFSATTGTFSGNLTVAGVPTFYGALTLPYFTATSTSATSTIAGQFVNTFVPSVAHSFGAWSPGVSGSNPLTASMIINPSSATADSNLLALAVNNSAKFLIDAEGDVFANSLTASGGVTLSTTTASTFSVENNSTFGDSTTTDRTYFNSRIGSSLVPNTNNLLDIGDTTNWFSWRTGLFGTSVGVGGTATSTGLQLTASGAYIIDSGGVLSLNTANNQNIVTGTGNFGIGTSSPYAKLSVVGPVIAEYFHATSTTATSLFSGALTVNGNSLFTNATSTNFFSTTASSTNLFAQAASVGTLAASSISNFTGLTTFANGFLSNASSTITGGLFSANGGASTTQLTTTGSTYLATAGGKVGIGTTTPNWLFQVAGTRPSLALSDTSAGVNLKHWLFSSMGGNLYIGTSTDSYATSTPAVLTVSNAGNVGIGTTAPATALHVVKDLSLGSDTTYPLHAGSKTNPIRRVVIGYDDVSNKGVIAASESSVAWRDLLLNPNGGNVGINTSNPSSALYVNGTMTIGPGYKIFQSRNDSTLEYAQEYTRNGSRIGGIYLDAASVQYITTSDRRLKENIATTTVGLSTLLQIPVNDFNFISDPNHTNIQGFIAQDLYNYYPAAVVVGGDNATSNPWQVDYGRLTPLIISSVQDLNAKFETRTSFIANAATSTVLTVDVAGNVGIGTTAPNDGKVEVKGGTVCVDTNSDDSATSCIASESDERLKTNIQAISASSSLETILALNPVSFDWRATDPEVLKHWPTIGRFASSTHSIGLIAQEVMPVLPEALSLETVGDSEVQYFQLDYTKFIPHLVGAVKELWAKVQDLGQKVAALFESVEEQNAKIQALEARVNELESQTGAGG